MSATWREKLQAAMDDRGVSQYAPAQSTGIRQPRISQWLSGTGEPGLEQWGLLCKALDVPLSAFLPEHLSGAVPDYRSEEEQMLVRVARKVGVQGLWELIAEAAIHGRGPRPEPDPTPPSSGPIKPIRAIGRQVGGPDENPPAGPGEGGNDRKKPPKRQK